MEITKRQVTLQVLVIFGPGVGVRKHEEQEVVHLSLQFVSESGREGVITSSDPHQPHCFHHSRLCGLELAKALMPEIEALGFGGPAIALRIPGIPFEQDQDAGFHISLYNRPTGEAVSYTPPEAAACLAVAGRRFTVTIDGPLKILNGNEKNDLKVGGCYYVTQDCGSEVSSLARNVRTMVGLEHDESQHFHLSLATLAPSWLPFHPKSAAASQANNAALICEQAFQTLRHGDARSGFVGFNDDTVTGWTQHAAKLTEAERWNAKISKKIACLTDPDLVHSLQEQQVNIRTLGFCQAVGHAERIQKIRRVRRCHTTSPHCKKHQVVSECADISGKLLGLGGAAVHGDLWRAAGQLSGSAAVEKPRTLVKSPGSSTSTIAPASF